MTTIITRLGKGSPLTNAEMDANLTNLNNDKLEVSAFEAIKDATGEPMGFVNRTDSAISFNNTNRTFTIQPVSVSYEIWTKGVKRIITTANSIAVPNTTGLYYIYYDADGVLQQQSSFFDLQTETPVAYVYWNATTAVAPFVADERHGVVLDWQTHEYLHRTRGAVIASGFSISNYSTTGTGALDSDAQFDLGGGTFFDEDLKVQIIHSNTPTANTFEQDLQGPARIPMFYLNGAGGWVLDAPTDYAVKAGTNRPKYNLNTAGTWTTPDVPTNTHYTTTFVIATNNINYPVIGIMGQSTSNAIGDQEAVAFSNLTLTGFPVVEFRPLYKIIWQVNSGYANIINARIAAVYDLRTISSAGVSAQVASDHGGLSGLGDDDHLQYVHTTESRTITANHVFTGSTTFANTTLTGELRGPETFIIDPAAVGDNTGTVVIKGNLQIDGTTTTINSTTITIDDKNLVLADGAANAAAANGAGITITGAGATFNYVSTGDKWQANKSIETNSQLISTVTGGTAPIVVASSALVSNLNADLLDGQQGTYYLDWTNTTNKPSPVITLGGDLTGSVTLTSLGSGTLTATIAANSVALGTDTTGNYVANLTAGTGIAITGTLGEGWSPTVSIDSTVATLTGTQTLTNKTINGASNTLSNIANASLTNSAVTIGTTAISLGASSTTLAGLSSVTSTSFVGALTGNASTATTLQTTRTIGDVNFNGSTNIVPERILYKDTRGVDFTPFTYAGVTLHLKNNTVDGLSDGATYHGVLNLQHWSDNSGGDNNQLAFTDNGNIHFRQSTNATTWGAWSKIWHSSNDGASSGLDADLLDGQEGSYYLDWTNATNKPDPVITLAGDLTGSVTLTDLTSGTLTATIAANSVALGTDTTGNYLLDVSPGAGIVISHIQGEGSTATISHADTSSVSNLVASARTYVTGLTFDTFGHVTALTTASESVTNTTYAISAETVTGGANLRLTGSDAVTDDVKIQGSGIAVVSRTDANTITVAATEADTLATVTGRGNTTTSTITHGGLVPSAGTNIDQIYSATVSLTLSTGWQDTTVNAAELSTGSYIVQVAVNDNAVGGGHFTEFYTGVMSWYAGGDVNSVISDEIVLHRAGVAPNAGTLFLRTIRTIAANTDDLKLQIAGTTTNSAASNYVFKFRRLM